MTGYRLDLRLALVVSASSLITLLAVGSILAGEFTRGQFAIEERGLTSQAREWTGRVRRQADGSIRFQRPPEPDEAPDPPYTGLLTGSHPVYGYAVVDDRGRILDRSAAGAPAGLPGPPRSGLHLSTGVALDGSGPLLIAEAYVPEDGVWFRLTRARSDVDALVNTFFAESLKELGWAAVLTLLVMLLSAVAIVRLSLSGLRDVAAQAQRITFETLGQKRLSARSAPAEVQPLISAVNLALDSIEAGAGAQRDFSINAAHELRTPLADLRLRLEGLPVGTERDIALRDIDAMARLIEQLLTIARLDGSAAFALQPLDLSRTVEELLGEAAPRLVVGGWCVAAELPSSPVQVVGDAALIGLILRNLLENVRRHTPAGTRVTISVSAEGELAFADSGPGLPPELPDCGFARFVRGNANNRTGSGLGLSICETAMKRMGGSFHRDRSVPGTLFRMTFRRLPDQPV